MNKLNDNEVAKVRTVRLSDKVYNYITLHHVSLASFVKKQVELEQQLKSLSNLK